MVFNLVHRLRRNSSISAAPKSRMDMRQAVVRNFNVVSYNRFNSCEETDYQNENDLANESIRNIKSGRVPTQTRGTSHIKQLTHSKNLYGDEHEHNVTNCFLHILEMIFEKLIHAVTLCPYILILLLNSQI